MIFINLLLKNQFFEDLKSLYIAATDILKGEINYFSEGELSYCFVSL
jgi:hypothetical protein